MGGGALFCFLYLKETKAEKGVNGGFQDLGFVSSIFTNSGCLADQDVRVFGMETGAVLQF